MKTGKHRRNAILYTAAMVVGLVVGAYFFHPVGGVVGAFAGLYVVALIQGKLRAVGRLGSRHPYNEMEDLVDGEGLPGSGQDPH